MLDDVDWKDVAIHAGAAVAVVILAGVLGAAVAGWMVVSAWFYGREVAHAERKNPALRVGLRRLLPWSWHPASVVEFAAPVVAGGIAVGLVRTVSALVG